jgi:hypothetical protein
MVATIAPGPASNGVPSGEEDRHRARRVDDHEQRDEDFPEELHDRLLTSRFVSLATA